MPSQNIGRIRPVIKGAWVSGTNYKELDIVTVSGSSYIRKVAGAGTTTPASDTTNWELVASKGLDGSGTSVNNGAVTNITGLIKGNGSTISAAVAGTDYAGISNTNVFSAVQDFTASGITLKGSSTGKTTFASANASVTNYTITFPASTGTVLTTASSGVNYAPATSGTSILKGNASGGFSNAVAGTDYAGISNTNVFTVDQRINGVNIGAGTHVDFANMRNTFVGFLALSDGGQGFGNDNTAVGWQAMRWGNGSWTTTNGNTAIGADSLKNNTGSWNTACGYYALYSNGSGQDNTAIGKDALSSNTTGSTNTACGKQALDSTTTFVNVSGFGFNAQVTGSNQVQLGNSSTTTYVYGTVANRSDLRDKADVQNTQLGLNFINALRPVDYRWDMREDYKPIAPERIEIPVDATDEQRDEIELQNKQARDAWVESAKLSNITRDGSKKRSRLHHGLIAQEVKAVIDATGVDFGGYQDHSINGGDDALTIGYDELIAPLIKAIQELSADFEAYKLAHP
jgi:hypothetical protein